MNCGRRWRRLGARASRPRAASQGGKSASGRPARPLRPVWEHCGAIAIAGDRHELRSTLAPPGSAGVSPACAPEARAPRLSGRPARPLRPVWEHCGAIAIAGDRNEFRSTPSPPGSAGVSPTCSLTGGAKAHQDAPHAPFAPCGSIAGRSQSQATDMNCGRRWRRLGARASRPRAASQGGAKAHQDTPHSPFAPCGSIAGRSQSRATDMNCGRRCRRLGARASRPRAASQGEQKRIRTPRTPPSPCVGALRGDRNRRRPT